MIQYLVNCPECNEDFECFVNTRVSRPRVICSSCDSEFFLEDVKDSAYAIPVKQADIPMSQILRSRS